MKGKYLVAVVFSISVAVQYTASAEENSKAEQMEQYAVNSAGQQETTQFGQRINNTDSLKAGLGGPTLLEDFMMREKIMHFGNFETSF